MVLVMLEVDDWNALWVRGSATVSKVLEGPAGDPADTISGVEGSKKGGPNASG